MTLLGIALLGGAGAVARVLVGRTLFVNLAGTFVLGVLAGAGVHGDARRLAAVGFLGAFTTFSTWMYESRAHWTRLPLVLAAGLAAVWLGRTLG